MWQFADASPVLQRILRMTRSSRLRCQLELTISSLAISGSVIVFPRFRVSPWSRQRNASASSFTKPSVRGVSQNPLSRGTSETLLLRRLLRQWVMPGLVWIPAVKQVSQKRSFLRQFQGSLPYSCDISRKEPNMRYYKVLAATSTPDHARHWAARRRGSPERSPGLAPPSRCDDFLNPPTGPNP